MRNVARHSVIVSMVVTAVVQLTRAGLTDLMNVIGLFVRRALLLSRPLARDDVVVRAVLLAVVVEACLQLSAIIEVRSKLGARALELTVILMLLDRAALSSESTNPTSIIRLLNVLNSGVRLVIACRRVSCEAFVTHNLSVCLLLVTLLKVRVSALVSASTVRHLPCVFTRCM